MKTLTLLALAVLVPLFQGVYSQQGPVCSPRIGNLNRCLAGIRARALDTVNSHHGEPYFRRCPLQDRSSINCFEYERITEPQSMAQLSLGTHSPDLTTLNRLLNIEYVSPAGSYTGCDHTYTYPNEKRFFINPLSDRAFPSWDLREQPIYSWDYNDGERFTLISRDANGATHHVVVNIQGDDVANGLHLFAYDGHRNFHNVPRPNTFMLFRQTRQLFVERIPSAAFNVTEFAERHQLQGPVAFSWVNAAYDAYSVSAFEHGENCAGLVQDALRPVLPTVDYLPNEVDLKVFLRYHRTAAARPYDCGMYTITPPPREYYLDPISPEAVVATTSDLRLGSRGTFSMTMNKVNPQPRDFDGKLHTLMTLSRTTQNLHGMIVNVEGNNVTSQSGSLSSGFYAVPFTMPQIQPNGQNHFFDTLVFEQAVRIPTALDLTSYISQHGDLRSADDSKLVPDPSTPLVDAPRLTLSRSWTRPHAPPIHQEDSKLVPNQPNFPPC